MNFFFKYNCFPLSQLNIYNNIIINNNIILCITRYIYNVYTINLLFLTLSPPVIIIIQTSVSHVLFICRTVDNIKCSAILHTIYCPNKTIGIKNIIYFFERVIFIYIYIYYIYYGTFQSGRETHCPIHPRENNSWYGELKELIVQFNFVYCL